MSKCRCDICVEGYDRRQEIKHGGVTDEELPYRSPRKNTKRWCKGKVGREHELHLVTYPWYSINECKNCGKQIWQFKGWDY